jgi:flagellar biosynthesis protein FlhA
MLIIAILIPAPLLDVSFILVFSFALLALITSMIINNTHVIYDYPKILFIVTVFRIALSLASAKLILFHGDAGQVIAAIGNYVTSGNIVVGTIIFIVFTIAQFAIITKGPTRMAKVAARFALDSMPAKQMLADADLNAGRITEEEARKRRDDITREADFYGAMEGASKFVKIDAIISIIIICINIISSVTLAIGYGVATQISALIISISSGIIIARTVRLSQSMASATA